MMRQGLIAANWKMNGRLSDVNVFVDALNQLNPTTADVIFAPPFVYLGGIDAKQFQLAAQNASEHSDGAFTGEISMAMLKDIGGHYVIVGHSERRAIYGETDEVIFNKVIAAFKNGLIPILCIGETDEDNQQGKTENVLNKQLALATQQLSTEQKQQIVIAYEPVWAIGTGRTPSVDEIEKIHKKIRSIFAQNDDTIASALRVLYGGSVKPDNAKAIFSCPDVDGGLVGGASLTFDLFKEIIKAY